jgi:1,4-alpha-glucan branching enzyme
MEKEKKKRIKKRRVIMTLKAQGAGKVCLMGDFNNWNQTIHPMKQNEKGVWGKNVMLPAGRYEYKFLVDGEWWNDPENRDFCRNCFGTLNSVTVVC